MKGGFVHVERKGQYAIATIRREPVNTMDRELWMEMKSVLTRLEADPEIRGLIWCSGLRRDVFTAGNDIKELYAPMTSRDAYVEFWRLQNEFAQQLYMSRLATVCAIRGACPAGGCFVSLCCDASVMTEGGSIGLNEVLLSIPVPKFWGKLMALRVGAKQAEDLLLTGRLVDSKTAKGMGLVDELVPKDQLMPVAEKLVQTLIRVPSEARAVTKQFLREDFVKEWKSYLIHEGGSAWDNFLTNPSVVEALQGVLSRLSKGSSKL